MNTENSVGRLSVVATPIGNLEDITLRALRILGEVAYVLCEDTRVTGKLLAHYDIKTTLRRYDAHASAGVESAILADLASGKHIALVSDAGTPGISDPGVHLVARVKAELPDIRIDAIPGASAVTAAFSIAGIAGNEFTFRGFVPTKKGRETFFRSLRDYTHPVVFYESVHRIMKTLESLALHLAPVAEETDPDLKKVEPSPAVGDVTWYEDDVKENSTVNRTITVAREITKMHEAVVQGTPAEVLAYFTNHPDQVRGEFVVLVN